MGTVVDAEFPAEELPPVNDAIEIAIDGGKLLAEVQQHLGNNWVRCLAMGSTDGLRRGAEAVGLGGPIKVPVGPSTMGRLFNVLGEAIDILFRTRFFTSLSKGLTLNFHNIHGKIYHPRITH